MTRPNTATFRSTKLCVGRNDKTFELGFSPLYSEEFFFFSIKKNKVYYLFSISKHDTGQEE